jgi:hypothetical protein
MQSKHFSEAIRQFIFFEEGRGGEACIRIEGHSMQPFLQDGQMVYVSPYTGMPRIGHCYGFLFNNNLLLHRLVFFSKKNAYFIGDSGRYFEKVPRKNIVAVLSIKYKRTALLMITLANYIYFLLAFYKHPSPMEKIRSKWLAFWTKGGMLHERTL